MTIRELFYDNFDINTNIKIYDGAKLTREASTLLYSGFGSPADIPDKILDMDITYITTDGDCIVLEGKFASMPTNI